MNFNSKWIFAACCGALLSNLAYGFEYQDDFENWKPGSLTKVDFNRAATKSEPLIWGSGVYTKVVSLSDGVSGIEEPVPASPSHPKISTDPEAAQKACSNCVLRFYYKGTSLDKDSWAEQRFKLNPEFLGEKKGLRNIWVQYDQYIPENFQIRDPVPTSKNHYGGAGDKEFALFADEYSKGNPTFILARLFRRADFGDPNLQDTAYPHKYFFTRKPDGSKRTFSRQDGRDVVLIDPLLDKGHWQRRTLHIQMPSSESSDDGVIELWVTRRVETSNPTTVKVIEHHDGNFHGGDQNYLNKGYILGWSNTGYDEATVFLIDNFILSDSHTSLDMSGIDYSATNVPSGQVGSVSASAYIPE